MNCSTKYPCCVIKIFHTVLGFLSFTVGSDLKGSCSIHAVLQSVYCLPVTDEVHVREIRRLSSQVNAKQENMSELHDDMMNTLMPLTNAGSALYLRVDRVQNGEWNFFLVVAFFCCDLPEGEGLSLSKHIVATRRSCLRYLVTRDDIRDVQETDKQHV